MTRDELMQLLRVARNLSIPDREVLAEVCDAAIETIERQSARIDRLVAALERIANMEASQDSSIRRIAEAALDDAKDADT